MSKASTAAILPASAISHRIYFLRKTRVMLDSDLAQLYGVTTSILNQAVRRNYNRFPKDFMFQLTKKDAEVLRSQFAISNKAGRGGRRYLPHAFTEHGIAMLSSVLHSGRAVQVNIAIMRAFVQLRAMLATLREMLETPIPPKTPDRISLPNRTCLKRESGPSQNPKSLNYLYLFIHNPQPPA